MSDKNLKVSLITTERNEREAIAEFIESAMGQSMAPDEIVIADGGSTDGTVEIIQDYIKKGAPIKLVQAPGNRAVGRNAATQAARNAIIACTDVGSRLDKDWLKNITKPFADNPNAMAVAGMFVPDPQTYFEKVSTTLMLAPNDKIDLETWLPSSRSVAYKKSAWQAAGGYPEHTNFNEDTPFDLALKAKGFKFEDGLKAVVYWRPRSNLREFYQQYYFYAVGDGLDLLNRRSMLLLSIKYLTIVGLTIGLAAYHSWLALVPLVYFLLRLGLRVRRAGRKIGGLKTYLLMMVVAVTFDWSQILGYWYGYLNRDRLRNSQKLVR